MAPSAVALRTATRADAALLRRAFAEAGHEPPAQDADTAGLLAARGFRAHVAELRSRYPRAATSIMLAGALEVGAITLDRTGDRVHVVDIVVLAPHRRRGIASLALRELVRPSDRATAFVAVTDIGSRRFFERNGFEAVAEQFGHLLMATGADD